MKFWDSSAVIPLCLHEPASVQAGERLNADEDMVVWWSARVECLSALERRRREGALPMETLVNARALLSALATAWSEVLPGERVRQRAERLLAVHPLRTADAPQLAAALIWAEEAPQFSSGNQSLLSTFQIVIYIVYFIKKFYTDRYKVPEKNLSSAQVKHKPISGS